MSIAFIILSTQAELAKQPILEKVEKVIESGVFLEGPQNHS